MRKCLPVALVFVTIGAPALRGRARSLDWELAVFPVENHGFTERSSWTDEYRRILRLFEENLRDGR